MRKLPLTRKIETMKINQVITVNIAENQNKKDVQVLTLKTAQRLNFIVVTKAIRDKVKIWRVE